MAKENKENKDVPKTDTAAVVASVDPEAARIIEEAAAAEAAAAAAAEAALAGPQSPPVNPPQMSSTYVVPTLEEWLEAGYAREDYFVRFGPNPTPTSRRGLERQGDDLSAHDQVLAAMSPSAREQILARASARVQRDRHNIEHPGDIVVTALQNNSAVRLGGRPYVLKKGHELYMDPSHAVELASTGWVQPVRIIESRGGAYRT